MVWCDGQVADIGLMGAPAKKDGKAVEGVDIFLGGVVGEGESSRSHGGGMVRRGQRLMSCDVL